MILSTSGIAQKFSDPLAAVVIGGLITSTLLTLFLLPAIYEWMEMRTESGDVGKAVY